MAGRSCCTQTPSTAAPTATGCTRPRGARCTLLSACCCVTLIAMVWSVEGLHRHESPSPSALGTLSTGWHSSQELGLWRLSVLTSPSRGPLPYLGLQGLLPEACAPQLRRLISLWVTGTREEAAVWHVGALNKSGHFSWTCRFLVPMPLSDVCLLDSPSLTHPLAGPRPAHTFRSLLLRPLPLGSYFLTKSPTFSPSFPTGPSSTPKAPGTLGSPLW